jgi:ABC-type dipeptide/oligopeptide/nickel transport system permease component
LKEGSSALSPELLEAILAYATIPAYVIGLLVLIYIVARTQLRYSPLKQAEQSLRNELSLKPPKASVSAYLLVCLLFALYVLLTITTQRRQQL